jgi:hypothetical protein
MKFHNLPISKEKCLKCNGLGKVQWENARCNCGSGEGCDIHDEAAISLWGKICDTCKGTGLKK